MEYLTEHVAEIAWNISLWNGPETARAHSTTVTSHDRQNRFFK